MLRDDALLQASSKSVSELPRRIDAPGCFEKPENRLPRRPRVAGRAVPRNRLAGYTCGYEPQRRPRARIQDSCRDPRHPWRAGVQIDRVLESLPRARVVAEDIAQIVADGRIDSIPGIGASSRKIIEDVIRTGESADLKALRASVPGGLIDLLEIPSLGPKTIALLWRERGIESIDQLGAAIDAGQLAGIKGLGEKKIAGIRQGIELLKQSAGRVGIAIALPIAGAFVELVRAMPQVEQAEYAGSLRRRRETVGDIDIIAALKPKHAGDGESVTSAFTKLPGIKHVMGAGSTKASVLTESGVQVDLRIVPRRNFGAALLYFTGSKDHNVRIRSRAQDRGLTLNEWGLYHADEWEKSDRKPGEAPTLKAIASAAESDVYHALDLQFIEPEMREDRGEVALSEQDKLPTLLTLADMRGDLHMHTRASDGVNTIEEMAEAARALGYAYIAITDHSKSQAIANGLSAERLLAHVASIRKASDKIKGITILAGTEVDILADGHLDYEDAVLAELDWVVASPHTSLKQESSKATDRLLRAIDNRHVNVIGHPTGRLIGARDGLPLDFARLYKACRDTGTALEINAGWPRLDLDDVRARGAIDAGVMLTIDTDAHSIEGLRALHLGIGVARRAWVEPRHVLNTHPIARVRAFVRAKR